MLMTQHLLLLLMMMMALQCQLAAAAATAASSSSCSCSSGCDVHGCTLCGPLLMKCEDRLRAGRRGTAYLPNTKTWGQTACKCCSAGG
jgi:hypothetical protein